MLQRRKQLVQVKPVEVSTTMDTIGLIINNEAIMVVVAAVAVVETMVEDHVVKFMVFLATQL